MQRMGVFARWENREKNLTGVHIRLVLQETPSRRRNRWNSPEIGHDYGRTKQQLREKEHERKSTLKGKES